MTSYGHGLALGKLRTLALARTSFLFLRRLCNYSASLIGVHILVQHKWSFLGSFLKLNCLRGPVLLRVPIRLRNLRIGARLLKLIHSTIIATINQNLLLR